MTCIAQKMMDITKVRKVYGTDTSEEQRPSLEQSVKEQKFSPKGEPEFPGNMQMQS